MSRARAIWLMLALATVTAVGGCDATADKAGGAKAHPVVVLHVLNSRDGAGEARRFVDKVAELSRGTLRLDVENWWEHGSPTSEADIIRAIQSDRADLAIVPARVWRGAGVTSFDALIAPLTVDSMALQDRVLNSNLPNQMLTGLTRLGLVGVGIVPGPMRKPAGISRPLVMASDYRGATVGISPSVVASRVMRALGATPVDSAFEGAAITGFDGVELQVATVAENQYDSVVRSITENVNLWPRPLVIFTSVKTVQRLSQQQLTWLRSAAHAALDATAQAQVDFDTEDMAVMCRRGKLHLVSATPKQMTQFRLALQPVYAWLREDKQTGSFLDQIQALRGGGVTPYPRESLSCAGSASGS